MTKNEIKTDLTSNNSIQIMLINYLFFFLCVQMGIGENVPVYIWGTNKLPFEKSPAFLNENMTFLVNNTNYTILLVFLEPALGVEDLSYQNRFGESPFTFLRNQKNAIYKQNVHNSNETIKTLKKTIHSIKIFDLFPYLDPNETRFDLLKRHDLFMNQTFAKYEQKYRNIAAVYTGLSNPLRQTLHLRAKRQDDAPSPSTTKSILFKTPNILMQLAEPGTLTIDDKRYQIESATASVTLYNDSAVLEITKSDLVLNITIAKHIKSWSMTQITATITELNKTVKFRIPIHQVSSSATFVCEYAVFVSSENAIELHGLSLKTHFGTSGASLESVVSDEYEDCVGFFSIPILAGLSVSAFLLSITLFGVYMIGNIQTMDRFNTVSHMLNLPGED